MAKYQPDRLFRGKQTLEDVEKISKVSLAELVALASASEGPFTLALIASLEPQAIVDFTEGDVSLASALKLRAAANQLITDNRDGVYISGGTVIARDIRGGNQVVPGGQTKVIGSHNSVNVGSGVSFGQIAAGEGIEQTGSPREGKIAVSGGRGSRIRVNIADTDEIDITVD